MSQTETANRVDVGAALMRALQDGLIVRGTDGAIVDVNDAFCALVGFGRDELIGDRPPHVFWPAESQAEMVQAIEAALGGDKWERDFVYVKNGGERIHVIVNASPVYGDDDRVQGLVSTVKDVTFRKHAERELSEAAQFNHTVLSSLAAHICVVDRRGVIVATNDAWQQFARENQSPGAYHGCNYLEVCAQSQGTFSEEGGAVAEGIRDVLEGRRSAFTLEYPCHSEQEQRWFLLTVTPMKGRTGGAVVSHLNITDRKRAELQLGQSLERLKASEESIRRHAVAMTRLARQLKRSNEELDQFAYVTSHDLKAPLRGIANLSRWIEEDLGANMTPEAHEQMNLLRGRVHRMEHLIEGLLQYSRIGRTSAPVEQVDVGQLLHDVVDLLSPPATMRIKWPQDALQIVGRKLALQQVLMNLVSNAIKHHHTKQGEVCITWSEDEDLIEFRVSDDGPGISPEYHEKVFVIFQTLQPRDKVEGAGIGLAMVKKTVEREGGQIRIESTPGSGATFVFTWPKVASHEENV